MAHLWGGNSTYLCSFPTSVIRYTYRMSLGTTSVLYAAHGRWYLGDIIQRLATPSIAPRDGAILVSGLTGLLAQLKWHSVSLSSSTS